MNARTQAERRQVEQSIETNATLWAEMIRSGDVLGYRVQRDVFCWVQRGG